MLTISKAQLESFTGWSFRDFEVRAMRYLESEYPEQYQLRGKKDINGLLQRSIQRTKNYRLNTERGIIIWTEISIIYGENFFNDELWAQNILNNFGLDIQFQIERLKGYIIK